jgi:hypothetical protein
MTDPSSSLRVEVRGDLIIVTESKTGHYAIYSKPKGDPWLNVQGLPTGTHEVKAHAWQAAVDKARDLGWIV